MGGHVVGEVRLLLFSKTDAKSSVDESLTTAFTFEPAEPTQFCFYLWEDLIDPRGNLKEKLSQRETELHSKPN